MYLLFKSVNAQQAGLVQQVSRWMEYSIGYLPDTHVDLVEYRHLNPVVIDESIKDGWMFLTAWDNQLSVRDGTPQNEALDVIASEEATGTKVKYNLTADDIAAGVEFSKAIMRHKLDEVFDKKLVNLHLSVSELEFNTWEQQKNEAQNGGGSLMQSLATARGITEAEMVQKVLDAVDSYNTSVGQLLADKQAVEKLVKECTTIADCTRLMHTHFGINAPVPQVQDEGLSLPAYLI